MEGILPVTNLDTPQDLTDLFASMVPVHFDGRIILQCLIDVWCH